MPSIYTDYVHITYVIPLVLLLWRTLTKTAGDLDKVGLHPFGNEEGVFWKDPSGNGFGCGY